MSSRIFAGFQHGRIVLTREGVELVTPYTAEDWNHLGPSAGEVLLCFATDLITEDQKLLSRGRTVAYWAARLRSLLGDEGFLGLIAALREDGWDVAALLDSETPACSAQSSAAQ